MRYIKVKEDENLVRDENTNALINTNLNEYKNYIELKKAKQRENLRIENIESMLTQLKNEIDEIKSLLERYDLKK